MARWTLLLVAMFLILACVMGCGDDDDDCPTCPEATVQPLGWTQGTVYLDPEAYTDYLYIYGMGAVTPNLDSIKFGDSLLNFGDDLDYDYEEDYHDIFWEVYFDEDGDESTYMWQHGDIGTISVWGEGRSSTCSLKMLDPDSCYIDTMVPGYSMDTIARTTSETVHWNVADGADYYGIFIELRDMNNGSSDWYYSFHYATDTFFVVTPDMRHDSTTYFYVNVTPFTGPDPRTGETNWTGTLLGGRLYSMGDYDYTRIHIEPVVVAGKANVGADAAEENRRIWKQTEIIDAIYNQAK